MGDELLVRFERATAGEQVVMTRAAAGWTLEILPSPAVGPRGRKYTGQSLTDVIERATLWLERVLSEGRR